MAPRRLIATVLMAVSTSAAFGPVAAADGQPLARSENACVGNAGDKRPELQDEVIVAARKERLRELTHDVAKAEDAFFDAYNRINTIPAFAVHCSVETPLGTHISRRECKPEFVEAAREAEASTIRSGFTEGSSDGTVPPPHGGSANLQISEKLRDYKRHLVEVASGDQNLRKMLQDYDRLKKRYDAALRDGMN